MILGKAPRGNSKQNEKYVSLRKGKSAWGTGNYIFIRRVPASGKGAMTALTREN